MAGMHGLEQLRLREIEQKRRSMLYALILMIAIVVTVGSIIGAYV